MLPTKCTVNSLLFQPFDKSIINWLDPTKPTFRAADAWLSRRAMVVGEQYRICRPDGSWSVVKNPKIATSETLNYYAGQQTDGKLTFGIDRDVAKRYWDCPLKVDGITVIPFGPEMVVYRGSLLLNKWHDRRKQPKNQSQSADYLPMLEIIYKSLCGGDEGASLTTMFNDLKRKDNVFSWAMHYHANIYQYPGRKAATAMTFIGEYGSGKGTLRTAMGALIGNEFVGSLLKSEIKRGWSDDMSGKLLVTGDEFEQEDKHDTYVFIKEHASDTEVSLAARNKGTQYTLNLTQFDFFTNNRQNFMPVKAGDRRHTLADGRLCHTEADKEHWQEWVRHRARMVVDTNYKAYREDYIDGFADLLGGIDVDFDFINQPFKTPKRAQLIAANLTALETLLVELNSQPGDSPAVRVRTWWNYQHGTPADDGVGPVTTILTPESWYKYVKVVTSFSRKNIKNYLSDHGYDEKDIFKRSWVVTEKPSYKRNLKLDSHS